MSRVPPGSDGEAAPGGPAPPAHRKKRPGSRLLLAVALAVVVPAGIYGGARLADAAAALAGISSPSVRLVLKVVLMAAALPAGFYLVERLFLARSTRRGRS